MEKILGIADVFSLDGSNFHPVVLIPIVVVVTGVVAIFVFGFKKVNNPKFHKIVAEDSGSKRQKRSAAALVETAVKATTNSATMASSNKVAKRTTPTKKEVFTAVKVDKAATVAKKNNIKVGSANTKAVGKVVQRKNTNNNNATTAVATTTKTKTKMVEEEGEWQTVQTKRQKKQTDNNQPLAVEATTKSPKTMTKQVKGKKESKKATTVAEELISQTGTQQTPMKTSTFAKHSVEQQNGNTLSFDELEDESWTESKTQRKNKKRALRE